MMPPKNRNQMFLDACLQHQEEENETVENGFNVEVNNLMETNNLSDILDDSTFTVGTMHSHMKTPSLLMPFSRMIAWLIFEMEFKVDTK